MLAFLAVAGPGSAQDVSFDRDIASSPAVLAPTTVIKRGGCSTVDCHPGIKEHSYLHGPLQVEACEACHTLEDAANHDFGYILPRRELCLRCHEFPGVEEGVRIHEPLLQGECLACHDPHGSEQKRAIVEADRAALCLTCHDALTDGRRLMHAPESGGSCSTCHEAHYAPHDKLLPRPSRTLCLSCHAQTAEQLSSAFLVHPPANDDCRLCHDPHASGGESMLVSDPVTLCTGCHEDVGYSMDAAVHPHAAMTVDKACLNCHQPHAGDHGNLLRGPSVDLCFQCHDAAVERTAGGTIPNIEAALREKTMTHSPAARGECVLCHQVHGGDRARLLTREFAIVYSPFTEAADYALCFSCHDKSLVLEETTDAVTAFRNGERNLHFVHVNSPKGRSCNICHDPHAADSDHLIRSSYLFGPVRWELPITWQVTANGGRCAGGCHSAYAYDRITPVEYPEGVEGEFGRVLETPSRLQDEIKR